MHVLIRRFLASLRTANHWLVAQFAIGLLSLLRLLPAKASTKTIVWLARNIGPLASRHRVALDNLALALPEKSEEERKTIALDMWENMARLAAEYIFLDKIFDYDPESRSIGRVEVEGKERFLNIKAESDRPHIFFTGHIGNFELLPICAATFDLDVKALFRPPNNRFIADHVNKARTISGGQLVPSKAGAALALARHLDDNGNVGMLVDQKFHFGLRTTFFGQECATSPLLAKLTRQYDCDVYPAYCIRLPNNRYRLVLEDKLTIPRLGNGPNTGKVDEHALTQMLNNTVERWIRNHPGQWMWFHKRWQKVEYAREKKRRG